ALLTLPKGASISKDTGQSLFAGIKQLVDQVLFITDIPPQQIRHEHIGKGVFPMKRPHHRLLLGAQKLAIRHCSCGSHAESLSCQRAFPKEIPLTQYADRGFLPRLRNDGEPTFAFLDIEDSVSCFPPA